MRKLLAGLLCITLLLMVALSGCSLAPKNNDKSSADNSAGSVSAATKSIESMEYTLETANGGRTGIYSGDIVDEIPSGQGTFVCKNPEGIGWTYTGGFSAGQFNGNGVCKWDSGSKREGQFYMGLQTAGKAYTDNGTLLYEGVFENGEPPALTDVEVTAMLADADHFIGRDVNNLLLRLELITENENPKGYVVVGTTGAFDAFFVSFLVEEELQSSIGEYLFVAGIVNSKIATSEGDNAVLLQDVTIIDPKAAKLDEKSTISLAEFDEMEIGMPYYVVAYMIGGNGELQAENKVAKVYQWEGDGAVGANAVISFQNGKLASKAQTGLE